jgi:hypothetical protein
MNRDTEVQNKGAARGRRGCGVGAPLAGALAQGRPQGRPYGINFCPRGRPIQKSPRSPGLSGKRERINAQSRFRRIRTKQKTNEKSRRISAMAPPGGLSWIYPARRTKRAPSRSRDRSSAGDPGWRSEDGSRGRRLVTAAPRAVPGIIWPALRPAREVHPWTGIGGRR